MSESVLITGVSTGIGYDAARFLQANGMHVFGSVRKQGDGERLQREFGDSFTPLLFDVTDETAVRASVETVREMLGGKSLLGLVNNAGIAVSGPMEHVPLAEFRRQFEVNVFGAVAVTQAFLPLMAKPNGRVVNISSVSGKMVYPYFGPYAGSKHALEAMSDAWRRELKLYGMFVSVVEPGSVETPIWEKAADENMLSQYQESAYHDSLTLMEKTVAQTAADAMPVEVVSRAIYHAITAERPKIRYALPNNWLVGWLLPRFMPQSWVDAVIARQLGLEYKA